MAVVINSNALKCDRRTGYLIRIKCNVGAYVRLHCSVVIEYVILPFVITQFVVVRFHVNFFTVLSEVTIYEYHMIEVT